MSLLIPAVLLVFAVLNAMSYNLTLEIHNNVGDNLWYAIRATPYNAPSTDIGMHVKELALHDVVNYFMTTYEKVTVGLIKLCSNPESSCSTYQCTCSYQISVDIQVTTSLVSVATADCSETNTLTVQVDPNQITPASPADYCGEYNCSTNHPNRNCVINNSGSTYVLTFLGS